MDLKKKARIPRCSRCRNHGFVAEFRGHAGKCLFAACTCWKCALVTERTRILATQRRINRTETTETPGTGPTTPAPTGTGPTTPARTGTGPGTSPRPRTGTGTPARTGTGPKAPARAETGHGIPPRPGTGPGTGPGTPTHPRTDPTRPARPEGQRSRDGIGAHSPGEYVAAEKPQMNTYSDEMLPMPLPIQMFPCPPEGYVFPVFLVNLQPPPPGTVREATGFPHLPPSVLAYPVEPGAPQTGSVPFCVSYSPLPWLQEECGTKPLHCPLSNRENDNGTEGSPSQSGHYSGSQESDVIIVDDDFPIKNGA